MRKVILTTIGLMMITVSLVFCYAREKHEVIIEPLERQEDIFFSESIDEVVVEQEDNSDNANILQEVEKLEEEPKSENKEKEKQENCIIEKSNDNTISDLIKQEEKEETITENIIKDNSSNIETNNTEENEVLENEENIIDEEIDVDTNETTTDDNIEEENIPQIDEEYEKMKQLYKYKTGDECYSASLKAYSKTYNENYRNAGCISGSYKGELIGFRIIIYFNDGTSMYYDEAI